MFSVGCVVRGTRAFRDGPTPENHFFSTGHDPARGSGLKVFKKSAGRVGPGQEVLKISRVGSGRVSPWLDRIRPARRGPTREKPCRKQKNVRRALCAVSCCVFFSHLFDLWMWPRVEALWAFSFFAVVAVLCYTVCWPSSATACHSTFLGGVAVFVVYNTCECFFFVSGMRF